MLGKVSKREGHTAERRITGSAAPFTAELDTLGGRVGRIRR